MKKLSMILICLLILSIFASLALAETEEDVAFLTNWEEIDSLKDGIHTLSWAYYTDYIGDYQRWYISNIETQSSLVDVYSLMPIKNGKAGWGTVGEKVATVNVPSNTVSVKNNLDSNPSNNYYDVGWGEWVSNALIHQDRQKIQGKNVPIRWFFFRVDKTGLWYIITSPKYLSDIKISRFSEKNGQYNWVPITSTNPIIEPKFSFSGNGPSTLSFNTIYIN